MALTINQAERDGVIILELSGRLVIGKECDAFNQQIEDLLDANENKIILKLEQVSYCDSFGIGWLVAALKAARDRGGDLKLLKLSKKVQAYLDVTKLNTVFDIHATEEEAVASFK